MDGFRSRSWRSCRKPRARRRKLLPALPLASRWCNGHAQRHGAGYLARSTTKSASIIGRHLMGPRRDRRARSERPGACVPSACARADRKVAARATLQQPVRTKIQICSERSERRGVLNKTFRAESALMPPPALANAKERAVVRQGKLVQVWGG